MAQIYDICVVFEGTKEDILNFLSFLNSIHPSIKFTYELEQSGTLPFLDLLITRN